MNISNNGIVYIKCEDGKIKPVKFKFYADKVIFRSTKKKALVTADGVNLFCTLIKDKKTETIICDTYVEVLGLLFDIDKMEKSLKGQIYIKNVPFNISFMTEGILFNLDLGIIEQSYAIIFAQRDIHVSFGKKAEKKDLEHQNTLPTESFFEALALIETNAKQLLKETFGDPHKLH